jgi:hypothetical protein
MEQHKWWLANKEKIRQRIIKSFGLPKDFKV